MSGISHLYDVYHKKGKEFIDNLFSSYVTVNEKMDGSAFVFERDPNDGKFIFYKRDQRNPITMVDRTLMKYYEKPIQYIESLTPHTITNIPRGWKFGLEYFANSKPVEIAYDRIPKNNLILSYVSPKDSKDSGDFINDKEKLDTWADLLGVERPPIIFQGYLNDEQKEKILDFLRTPFEDLVSEYKTKSFVRYIIGVLNPDAKESALNDDLDKAIEGIVFKFGDEKGGSETIVSKMVDPVFTEMAKNKSKARIENKPSDFLGLTILDVMNFILESGVDSFNMDGDSEDEKYISFISDVFSKFLDDYGYKYKGADFQEPDYLKKDEFRLNKNLIRDRRVLKYLEQDDAYESLFKLILNSFRKIKKRAGGIITSGIINQFNMLVSEIQKAVDKKETPKIQESQSIPSFLDFKKANISSKKIDYVTLENESEDFKDDHFFSYNDFISTLETIDSKEKPNAEPIEEKEESNDKKDKELQKVNLIIGRFQPFHKGHLKMANTLAKENDLPVIIAVVHPGHNKSGKSPFDMDLVNKYMESVVRENSKTIIGYFMVDRGLLGQIYGKAKELGYLPKFIGCGDDRIDDYKKQSQYLKKAGGDFPDDIEIVETPRTTSGTEVREKIDAEDFVAFKKLVPPSVSSFYQQLVSAKKGTGVNEELSEDSILDIEKIEEPYKTNISENVIMDLDGTEEGVVNDANNEKENNEK